MADTVAVPTVDVPAVDTASTSQRTWDMGLGPLKWIAAAGFAGMVAVLFAWLVLWGSKVVVDQAVTAHKATNELYLKIADQAAEERKNAREDNVRIWNAISDLSKTCQENTKINRETQELLLKTQESTTTLAKEVARLQPVQKVEKQE